MTDNDIVPDTTHRVCQHHGLAANQAKCLFALEMGAAK